MRAALMRFHASRPLPAAAARAASVRRVAARAGGSADAPAAAAAPHNAAAAAAAEEPIWYAGYPLDRAAHLRQDAAALARLLADPAARLLPLSGSRVLVADADAGDGNGGSSGSGGNGGSGSSGAKLRLAWVAPTPEALAALDANVPPLFLGLEPATGAPRFGGQAVRGAAADELAAAAGAAGARWAAARTAGPDLSAGDAALAATAVGLAQWHLAAAHDGASGKRTAGAEGGFARTAPSTGRATYPRIDPAIITLVTAGPDWALLGRKPEWPPGRYSTLAGFLEVGETLEQALAREVLEESAVRVAGGSARYVASQPWPFPRSLMVGFRAEARLVDGHGGGSGGIGSSEGSSSSSSGGGSRGFDLLHGPGRAAALGVGLRAAEAEAALLPDSRLPAPAPQPGEMDDVRWFHRDWLRAAVAVAAGGGGGSGGSWYSDANGGSSSGNGGGSGGGAPASDYLRQLEQCGAGPGACAGDFGGFQIPGPYSLAHRLISSWLAEAPAASSSSSCSGGGGGEAWPGDALPQVSIASGKFKYVLLRVREAGAAATAGAGAAAAPAAPRSKLLVWGHPAAEYHNHIYQRAKAAAARLGGLEVDVLGGGRIEHYPDQRVISVYGYSAAFGPAPHEVSAALLRRWFPLYGADAVAVSYDGY